MELHQSVSKAQAVFPVPAAAMGWGFNIPLNEHALLARLPLGKFALMLSSESPQENTNV